MTISGVTRTLVAVAAATALSVPTTPADARSQPDGPDFGAPTVGACSTMTAKQAAAQADHSTVVPCSEAHTAKVAGVVSVPDRLDFSQIAKLYRVMVNRCRPKVNALLGRTDRVRDSSAYDLVWFIPTKTQRQHGARWISCSVVLRQAFKLAKLPTNKTPLLPSGRLGEGIHRCLLKDTSRVITTRCVAGHGWRATGSFVISSSTYPGHKAINHKARTKCATRVIAGRSYRWTYSTKINWQVGGDHAVICYSKTSS
jgi:Septum formation